jgi:hypothetical protein
MDGPTWQAVSVLRARGRWSLLVTDLSGLLVPNNSRHLLVPAVFLLSRGGRIDKGRQRVSLSFKKKKDRQKLDIILIKGEERDIYIYI